MAEMARSLESLGVAPPAVNLQQNAPVAPQKPQKKGNTAIGVILIGIALILLPGILSLIAADGCSSIGIVMVCLPLVGTILFLGIREFYI